MSAQLPTELHKLKGTRATRADLAESGFTKGKPKMPKDLPPAAAEEWKRLSKSLSARGTLTKTDASAMEVYVRLFAHWKLVCAEIDKYGPMVDETDDKGNVRRVQNPAMKMAAALEHLIARYLASFSATPITREKTKPAAQPKPPAPEPGSPAALDEQLAALVEHRPAEPPAPATVLPSGIEGL
jgi:P27 family predicted phage terminase small subunit